MKYLALAAAALTALSVAQPSAALPRITEKVATPFVENAHYTGRRHSHRRYDLPRGRLQLDDDGIRRDYRGQLPQAHIDYCNRQNMGYRAYDNTIAYDRYFRVQCSSPYFRP